MAGGEEEKLDRELEAWPRCKPCNEGLLPPPSEPDEAQSSTCTTNNSTITASSSSSDIDHAVPIQPAAAGPAGGGAALKPPPTFSALFSIGPVQEAMFSSLTTVELLLQVAPVNRECNEWVKAELLHAGGGAVLGARDPGGGRGGGDPRRAVASLRGGARGAGAAGGGDVRAGRRPGERGAPLWPSRGPDLARGLRAAVARGGRHDRRAGGRRARLRLGGSEGAEGRGRALRVSSLLAGLVDRSWLADDREVHGHRQADLCGRRREPGYVAALATRTRACTA